jgi:hypothetical protein
VLLATVGKDGIPKAILLLFAKSPNIREQIDSSGLNKSLEFGFPLWDQSQREDDDGDSVLNRFLGMLCVECKKK